MKSLVFARKNVPIYGVFAKNSVLIPNWNYLGEILGGGIFRLGTFCEKKQGGRLYTVVFSPKIV